MAQYAAKLNNLNVGGTEVAGFRRRTRRALNHTWWANFFAAWGGDWFTADWKPRIDSPEAIAALEYAVNLLQYGPPNAADLGFVEVNTTWLNGGAAQCMHYQAMATSAQFDTRQSKVVDKTAVAELRPDRWSAQRDGRRAVSRCNGQEHAGRGGLPVGALVRPPR
jgi:hypothetical protein